MKRYVTFLMAGMLFCLPVLPALATVNQESSPSLFTGGWINGRFWQELDLQERIHYVTGLFEGVALLAGELKEEAKNEINTVDADFVVSVEGKLNVAGFRMSEVVEQINFVYADSANIKIPVSYVYSIAMKKLSGAPQEELDAMILMHRQLWNG